MVNLLAFDTSTEYLSLAIQKGSEIFNFNANVGQTHSQLILPKIQALLDEAHLTLNALNGIAFGAGPGSFTGVRIAAGVAQGLAYGADLPVASVCTLQALAEASGADKVIACIDARMGEVYFAVYEITAAGWYAVVAPSLHKPDNVPELAGTNWVGVGSGWQAYDAQLNQAYGAQLSATKPDLRPTAEVMLKLAMLEFQAGRAKPAAQVQPIYIRHRVALKTEEREKGLRL